MNAATSNFPSVVFKVLSQAHLSPPQKLQPIKRENKVNISYLLPWEEYWTCPDTRDCYSSEVPPQPPGPFGKPPSEGLNMAADLKKTTKWDRGQIPVTPQKKGEEDTSSLNMEKEPGPSQSLSGPTSSSQRNTFFSFSQMREFLQTWCQKLSFCLRSWAETDLMGDPARVLLLFSTGIFSGSRLSRTENHYFGLMLQNDELRLNNTIHLHIYSN